MTIEQLDKANEISYKLEKLRKCFNALVLQQGTKIEFDTGDLYIPAFPNVLKGIKDCLAKEIKELEKQLEEL